MKRIDVRTFGPKNGELLVVMTLTTRMPICEKNKELRFEKVRKVIAGQSVSPPYSVDWKHDGFVEGYFVEKRTK